MRRATFVLIAIALASPQSASAFCGFYVSGADASLYNNATMVVLMRDGTTTVLSMQNNYQGPPEDFAMVVPVPVVLQEENVKTLPREVFERVDHLAAPRLVEYWETDPCWVEPPHRYRMMPRTSAAPPAQMERRSDGDLGVTVEAQFSVAEYDIVILSARDSTGLDTWLRQEQYNIPAGAEPVLRPYVEAGTKFFVAKVDIERVTFQGGRAVLSPLRFHYQSPEFSLPVRLGLLNSGGNQDLLVHVLARAQRYEVANYPNTTIPTNIRVKNEVRDSWGSFYDLLFRRTIATHPGAVVTEYSWDARSCDPCPEPPLEPAEIMTLGADVVGGNPYGFVLTRMHYRYGREGLNNDLVFRAANPIIGGRGIPDQEGRLQEQQPQPDSYNNFQGRYVILHPWEGEIDCQQPVRGRWGGPPGTEGGMQPPAPPVPAENAALRGSGAPQGSIAAIGLVVDEDIAPLQIQRGVAEQPLAADPGPPGGGEPPAPAPTPGGGGSATTPATTTSEGGCASCAATPASTGAGAFAFLCIAVVGFALFRRRG